MCSFIWSFYLGKLKGIALLMTIWVFNITYKLITQVWGNSDIRFSWQFFQIRASLYYWARGCTDVFLDAWEDGIHGPVTSGPRGSPGCFSQHTLLTGWKQLARPALFSVVLEILIHFPGFLLADFEQKHQDAL